MRKRARIVVALALVVGAAICWQFYVDRMPSAGSFPLDLAALAGTTWDKIDMLRASYRLVYLIALRHESPRRARRSPGGVMLETQARG